MLRVVLPCALLAAFAAGCQDDTPKPAAPAPPRAAATPAKPARPDDTAVIRHWADTLRAGKVGAAASYFTVPSYAANGTPAITLLTRRDVRLFNASLPCGAVLLNTRRVGVYTVATFRLTERPGSGSCGPGTGRKAATAFRFSGRKISEWRRVPLPSGPPPRRRAKPSPEV